MTIREVPAVATTIPATPHTLQRVTLVDGQLYAEWAITLPNGTRASRSVPVSAAVNATLTERASFVALLDAVRDDTFPRTGAGG